MTRRFAPLAWAFLVPVCACHGTLDAGHGRLVSTGTTGEEPPPVPTPGPTTGPEVPAAPDPSDAGPGPAQPPTDPPAPPTPLDAGEATGGDVEAPDADVPPEPPSMEAGVDPGPATDLPFAFDAVNPVVIINDIATDSWQGEYAVLAASAGDLDLVGVVVNNTSYWPEIDSNVQGWNELLDAARQSGLLAVPELIVSEISPLSSPADPSDIESTQFSDSAGAQFLLQAASEYGSPERPLLVVTGSSLTDLAVAYLLDPTLADRVVAIAAAGSVNDTGGLVEGANGDLDPWASSIVAQRLRFIQVSAYYSQRDDVPETRAGELPANAFGTHMASKREGVGLPYAADQIGLLAVVLPGFALDFRRVQYTGWNGSEPNFVYQEQGCCWLVAESDGALAGEYLWQLLSTPGIFAD